MMMMMMTMTTCYWVRRDACCSAVPCHFSYERNMCSWVLVRCVSTWTGEWVTGCDLVFRPSMTHPHLQQVHHQLTTPLTWMTQHRALVRRRSPNYSITLMMTFHTDLMSITANSMRLKAILQDG